MKYEPYERFETLEVPMEPTRTLPPEVLAALSRPLSPAEAKRLADEARRTRMEIQEELDRRMRLTAEFRTFLVY